MRGCKDAILKFMFEQTHTHMLIIENTRIHTHLFYLGRQKLYVQCCGKNSKLRGVLNYLCICSPLFGNLATRFVRIKNDSLTDHLIQW